MTETKEKHWDEKRRFLLIVNLQLFAAEEALDATANKFHPKLLRLRMKGGIPRELTFSDLYHIILEDIRKHPIQLSEKPSFLTIKDCLEDEFDGKLRRDILDPSYNFNTDDRNVFQPEFRAVYSLVFSAGAERDARVDLALMKCLFAAGKIISKIESEGNSRSDKPKRAGRTKWKNKVNEQEIIEEFYRVDTNGKKPERICKEIREAFLKRGKKEDDLYSTKTIRKILKDEWPKIQ